MSWGLDLRAELDALKERQAAWSSEYRVWINSAIDADYAAEAEHDLTHCSECEQEWCSCDDARDNALTDVRVAPLQGGWFRLEDAA